MHRDIEYSVISAAFTNQDCNTYQGYGIQACIYRTGGMEFLGKVEDITTSLSQITAVVSLINRHHLAYIHLNDIVEDILVDG